MDVFCVYCGRGNRERIGEGGGVVFIDRFGVCVGVEARCRLRGRRR